MLDRGQTTGQTIIGVTIAVVIAITLLSPVVASIGDNTGSQTVTNETVTSSATLGETYDLDGFDVDPGSETVYFENGSAGSFEVATGGGTDYTLHEANGSITLESTGEIDAGDEVKVSYDYQATDDTTATVLGLVPLFVALLALVVVAGPMMSRM